MPKRKLTDKLKGYLYENRWSAKLSDYDGEALAYLKKLRSASKAAKKRKESKAVIGETEIPKDSRLYETISDAAQLKKMPVAKFIKKYRAEIDELLKNDSIPITRETSYAIRDINKLPKKSKIYINNEQVSKADAAYALQSLTSSLMQHTETAVVNYELTYDLKGNLYIELPTEEEIEEAEENPELYEDLLDDFDGIIVVKSPGKK